MNALVGAWLLGLGLAAAGPQASPPGPAGPETAPRAPVVDRVVQTRIRAALVADVLPRRDVSELRPTVDGTLTVSAGAATLHVDGRLEMLLADRGGRVVDAAFDARDAWVEWRGSVLDVRAGYGRLVWGRLDEVAPTDVINPTDAARFLFEGRSEARLPVTFLRGRFSPSETLRLEGVLAPRFRRGVFDRMDEPTSPFNLVNDVVPPAGVILSNPDRAQAMPASGWEGLSGGGRVEVTVGRVDGSVAVYRGFDAIGPIVFEATQPVPPAPPIVGQLVEHHPRFTMIGGDVETVTGQWAWRGEAAVFVDRTFAAPVAGLVPVFIPGQSIDAGGGFDRRAGDFRVFGMAIVHRQWSDADPAVDTTNVNLVGSLERSFGRERFLARTFAVINPSDGAGFLRGVWLWRLRDDVSIDVSGGVFIGTGDDTIAQFKGRDFVFGRMVYDF